MIQKLIHGPIDYIKHVRLCINNNIKITLGLIK